jgi:hypothetical protein
MFAICFGLPGGQPFEAGGVGVGVDAFVITAVGTEVAWLLPSLFVAIAGSGKRADVDRAQL